LCGKRYSYIETPKVALGHSHVQPNGISSYCLLSKQLNSVLEEGENGAVNVERALGRRD